jgi:hypothetical protein
VCLLTSESVGSSWLSGEVWSVLTWLLTSESVGGSQLSGDAWSVLMWLLTSESIGGSQLSGDAWSVLTWLLTSESVGGSQLSGDAPWVAFTPAGDGPIEHGVVPQFAKDPCWSVGSTVLSMSVLVVSRVECQVTNICGVLRQGSPIIWNIVSESCVLCQGSPNIWADVSEVACFIGVTRYVG